MYAVTCNNIAMGTSNGNGKNFLDDIGITTFSHGKNMPFIKYVDDKNKDRPNSIGEFKKIYKEFTDNDKL